MESNITPLNTLNSNSRIPSKASIINQNSSNIYGSVILPPTQGDTEAQARYTLSQMKNKIVYANNTGSLENKGVSKIVRWK